MFTYYMATHVAGTKNGHTHNPLTPWNAFVNMQLQILAPKCSAGRHKTSTTWQTVLDKLRLAKLVQDYLDN